ncbi:MAG: endopeptidase La [Oscillospiraceae bacterium]|nr:endopeptidase La [Oscillospiraceae bacterium]
MTNKNLFKNLPVVPLVGIVLFPGMTFHFDITSKSFISAVKTANAESGELFIPAMPEEKDLSPDNGEIEIFGAVVKILKFQKFFDRPGCARVAVEVKSRGIMRSVSRKYPFVLGDIELLKDDLTVENASEGDARLFSEAAMFSVRKFFSEFCSLSGKISPDIVNFVQTTPSPGALADAIGANVIIKFEDKFSLLSELNVYMRLEKLCVMLAYENEILALDNELNDRVDELMDKNQRDYYLREKLHAINEELGETDEADDGELYKKIENCKIPAELKEKLFEEFKRMRRLSPGSPDSHVIRSYIEKCLEIPWGIYTKENKNLSKAAKVLERDHYGLKEVKERITEMLASLIISPELKGQIICLAGPPGVGKTSIAKSIAAATGRNYVRIALGGVHDESEIRGHRRTYIGSMPGRIISALTDAKSLNPLILLDEVDKLGNDYKGDPASALLEVLDSEQNFSFRDHYIDMPVDLSKVLFLTTANDKYAIPDALRDRMEIIDLPGYTFEEKFNIAKKHLLPKQLKEHGLTKQNIKITDSALRAVIDGYTREAGVRVLERKIASLCRKESVRLASGISERLDITENELEKYLGVKKYRDEDKQNDPLTGVVNGLAWTSVGGEMLKVEVLSLEGTGKLELTGSLGDVMKESARAAVSFIRSRASDYGIDPDFYKNRDIHIHFPEGAVPKDGPSAGITVTTALASALSGKKARADIAMTGEISLTGRVMAIGGLREKSMAAYREGITTVFIPSANIPDLKEVDDAVKEKIVFVPVKYADEVISEVLLSDEDGENTVKTEKENKNIPAFRQKNRGGKRIEL